MRIVVADKRYHKHIQPRYTMDITINYKEIPSNIPLTVKSLRHWENTKNTVGYAKFNNLDTYDIKSILSAVKRQEGHLNVNRMGHTAFYKLYRKAK